MRFRMHRRCGPIDIEGVMATGFGPGWGRGWGPGPWGFDFPDPPPPPPGPGRGRRMFGSGQLRLVLLRLIADQPRHGYDLIRAIEELTHGQYAPSPGIVYPSLTMLQDMGMIREADAEGSRKLFAITPEGEAELEAKAEEVEAVMARLQGAGEHRRKAGRGPIKRAVGNLLSALWQRVTRDDMDEATLHEIASILDDAAQRIERIRKN